MVCYARHSRPKEIQYCGEVPAGIGEFRLPSDKETCKIKPLTVFVQSQQYHLNNPYWKTFDPYVLPLLDAPMDLRRLEEMETSVSGAGAHYHQDAVKEDTSVASMYNDAN